MSVLNFFERFCGALGSTRRQFWLSQREPRIFENAQCVFLERTGRSSWACISRNLQFGPQEFSALQKQKKNFILYLRGEFETSGRVSVYLKHWRFFCLHWTNGDPHMIAGNTWIEYLHYYFVWIAWPLVATDVIWTSCLWVCWTLSWFMGSELILAVNLNATILWDVTHVVWYNFPVKLRGVKFIVIQFQGHLIRRFSLGF